MSELGWPTILVALFFMLVTQLMFVHNLTQKKNELKTTENNDERKEDSTQAYEISLVPDKGCALFFNWLSTETDGTILKNMGIWELYGKGIELKRMQTVSPNNYQKVFSCDNKDDKFYFGRGDVQFCNRFDAVFSIRESSQIDSSAHTPTNGIYFGHIEYL
ncbi:hypothetical protein RFI_30501, partial [Reticulomyxa filosa]